MTIDILRPTPIKLRDGRKDYLEDLALYKAGVLDKLGFQNGYKEVVNPVEVRTARLVDNDEKINPILLVSDPALFTDPIEINGEIRDRAFGNKRRALTSVRRTKNLRVTMGRDQWQRPLMTGDVGASMNGLVGALTATTATTATGTGFPTAATSAGNTGLQGKIIVVGPNNAGAGSQVFGVIVSNTATVITVDQWYAIPVTGAAGTTPNATGFYTVLPGASPAFWVGLSTSVAAPAAADVLRTADGLYGDGTTGGAATEQNAAGLVRAYCGQGGTTAPTYGAGTYVLAHTWTYTGSSLVTLGKVVMCNSLPAAGSLLFLETLLSANASVNANGDTCQVTWTVTL